MSEESMINHPYAEENAPYVKQTSVVYIVRSPRPAEMKSEDVIRLYVEVDISDGLATLQPYSSFQGKNYKDMDHSERREVYDYLIEWELLEWRKIGPEDSELFATNNLLEQGERFILPARLER